MTTTNSPVTRAGNVEFPERIVKGFPLGINALREMRNNTHFVSAYARAVVL